MDGWVGVVPFRSIPRVDWDRWWTHHAQHHDLAIQPGEEEGTKWVAKDGPWEGKGKTRPIHVGDACR